MSSDEMTQANQQVDRFTDRLLHALANLDKCANGYDKREQAAPKPATADPGENH